MSHPTIETEDKLSGELHGQSCYCNVPETCGPVWWAMLHGWAKAINDHGCSSCGGFAVKFTTFFHDLVNLKLGKPLKDPKNFHEMARIIEQAAERVSGGHPQTPLPRHHQAGNGRHPNTTGA